jgi:hypothetical protein
VAPGGKAVAVVSFSVEAGRIVEIDVIADRSKLARIQSLTS